MDVLTKEQWVAAFAAYYERLAASSRRDKDLLERGRDLFEVWQHRHPLTIAAAQHRADAVGRPRSTST